MGVGNSRYSAKARKHRKKIKRLKGIFTEDAKDGDLILIKDRVPSRDDLMKAIQEDIALGERSQWHAKHTDFLDLELVQGIMKSQMGKATITRAVNVDGWNRVGLVATDRLGTQRLLMATDKGLESQALDNKLREFKADGTLVAIRQLHCNRENKGMMDTIQSVLDFTAGEGNLLPWRILKEPKNKAKDYQFTATTSARTFAKSLLLKVGEAKFEMSNETKAEISHFFRIYDVDGDGSIDEDEMEVMLGELLKDVVSTEQRLKFITRLDKDNNGDISFAEFFRAIGDLPGMVSRETRDTLGLLSAQFVTLVYQRMNLVPDPSLYEPIEPMSFSWVLEKEGEGVELTDGDLFPEVPLRVRSVAEQRAVARERQQSKKKQTSRQDPKYLRKLKKGKLPHVKHEPQVETPSHLPSTYASFDNDEKRGTSVATPDKPYDGPDDSNFAVEFGDGPLGLGFQSATFNGEDSVEIIQVAGFAQSCGVKVGDHIEEVTCLATKKFYTIGHEFVDQQELANILGKISRPIKIEFLRPTPPAVTEPPPMERVSVTFEEGKLGMAFAPVEQEWGGSRVAVVKVVPDGQADMAGVDIGDVFLVIESEEISPSATREDVFNILQSLARPINITFGRYLDEDESEANFAPTYSRMKRTMDNIAEESEEDDDES